MRNIIYARKCTGSGAERAESITAQIAQMRMVASRNNIAVAEEIADDDGSAREPGGRPMLAKLLQDIEDGHVDGILTTDMARLARNVTEEELIVQYLSEGKLQWIRTKGHVFTGSHDVHPPYHYGMVVQESMRRAVSRGMRHKVQRGGFPYRAPWGYTNDRLTKAVKPDPETFPRAKRAWKLLLEGKSIAEIAATIPFGPNALPSGRGTSATRTAFLRMFRNPFYCGLVRYREEVYPGAHVAAVSTDEFEAAQRFLNQNEGKRK